ncbi:MAG: insulinase family protein [Bacteroidia bacterium]|nr:insulinase family protein [Bacteroidia bacterium]MDW8236142.1 insulinase family protein [Bacteroidia bacterium]
MRRILRSFALLWITYAQPQLVFQDSLKQVFVYTLPNGLTVVVSPNPNEPRAFVMIATRAGSKQDPPDNTGLAHYLEHLLFKGTDRYGTKDFDREKPYLDAIESAYEAYNKSRDSVERLLIYKQIDSLAQLAAQWAIPNEYARMVSVIGAVGTNAFTSFDVTAYINDVPAHQVERLIKLEAERFRRPVFRLFHTELEAVYEEKNISLDNDERELNEKLMAALFPDHPYGTQTTIGKIAHLKNPSIRAIHNYYQTYYVPNNMVVIVAGDVQPRQVVAWVEKYFGGYSPRPIPKFPYEAHTPPPNKKPIKVEAIGPQPPQVWLAYRLPISNQRDEDILLVLDQLLSNPTSGLLNEWLVQTRRVKSAGSYPMDLADHTAHFLYAEPLPGESLEKVEKLLLESLRRVKKGDFDEGLIEAAINDLDFSRQKSWRSNRSRANFLLNIFVHRKDWKSELYTIDRLRTISKKEIIDFLRKYYGKSYVVAYKRQGERPPRPKIPKPPITPLPIERNLSSSYAEAFLTEAGEAALPTPSFITFDSVLQKGSLGGKVPFYALNNQEDSLFTLMWYVPVGVWHDKWLSFIQRYYEEVSPKGISLKEFKRKLTALGARLSFFIASTYTCVKVEGLVRNLAPTAKLIDSLLHYPAVDEKAWVFIRENVLKERADAKKSPTAIQQMLISYGFYGSQHPNKPRVSPNELRLMTAQELARRAAELWRYPYEIYYDGPGGIAVEPLLAQTLTMPSSWQSPPTPARFVMNETPEGKAYFVHFPMVRALLVWIHRSVRYQKDLNPVVSYFSEYFGGSMASVVFQQIREAKGLAYSARGYFLYPNYPDEHYRFIATISTQADKLVEARQAMEEIIDSLTIVPYLVQVAQRSLITEIAAKRLTHDEIFWELWEARRFGLPQEKNAYLWQALPHLSEKDLTAFYQTYLQKKPRLLLIIGDRERLPLEALRKQGIDLRELSLEEIFGY